MQKLNSKTNCTHSVTHAHVKTIIKCDCCGRVVKHAEVNSIQALRTAIKIRTLRESMNKASLTTAQAFHASAILIAACTSFAALLAL